MQLDKLPEKGLIHLNNNLLVAVDTETTGTKAGYHDLIEVCILPLDHEIRPHKQYHPFNLIICPKRPWNIDPEAMSVNKTVLANIVLNGMEAYYAADLFTEWFDKLRLPLGKRLAPLGQNYVFDRGFLIDWLGNESYNNIFDSRYRDSMVVATFFNDLADFRLEQTPFPKVHLQYLCSQLKIEREKAHNALDDCVATAEVYRKLLLKFLG